MKWGCRLLVGDLFPISILTIKKLINLKNFLVFDNAKINSIKATNKEIVNNEMNKLKLSEMMYLILIKRIYK